LRSGSEVSICDLRSGPSLETLHIHRSGAGNARTSGQHDQADRDYYAIR
jgi:hypothetical protein